MKIAFRLSSLGFGGAERVFISVAKHIANAGYPNPTFYVDHERGETIDVAKGFGFCVRSLNANRTRNSVLELARRIDDDQIDGVVSAYTETNIAAVISGRLSQRKPRLIVTEHASLEHHWQKHSRIKRQALRTAIRYLYPNAHSVIGVSQGIADQLALILPRKATGRIKRIYNPIRFDKVDISSTEIPLSQTRNPGRKVQLLSVGRVCKQKDYPTLIRALDVLRKAGLDYHQTIVGGAYEASEKEVLLQLLADYALNDRVTLVDYTEDVGRYYRAADIFVLSSAWEGFGNVIIEAMNFGLQVVSTDCPHGPAEILENGRLGRLVPVADANALAEAILATVRTPTATPSELQRRLSQFAEATIGAQYLDQITSGFNNLS